MNRTFSTIAKWGGLLVFGVAAFFFAQRLPGLSGDALAGLGGVVLGAFITVAAESWSGTLDRKNQLRLAAVERRLDAHQQAFTLWRKLIRNVHDEAKILAVVLECQEWWEKNCIYLTADAREKFRIAFVAAASHKDYTRDKTNPKLVSDNWLSITEAVDAILAGAELPSLGEKEAKLV